VGETGSHSQHVQDRPLASSSSWVLTEDRGFFRNMIVLFRSLWSDSRRFLQRQASTAPSEKSFVPLSATHMSEKSEGTQRPASMTQSTERRMSRLTVSIHHFREVMRNEVCRWLEKSESVTLTQAPAGAHCLYNRHQRSRLSHRTYRIPGISSSDLLGIHHWRELCVCGSLYAKIADFTSCQGQFCRCW
jgi:hypothetical protein